MEIKKLKYWADQNGIKWYDYSDAVHIDEHQTEKWVKELAAQAGMGVIHSGDTLVLKTVEEGCADDYYVVKVLRIGHKQPEAPCDALCVESCGGLPHRECACKCH